MKMKERKGVKENGRGSDCKENTSELLDRKRPELIRRKQKAEKTLTVFMGLLLFFGLTHLQAYSSEKSSKVAEERKPKVIKLPHYTLKYVSFFSSSSSLFLAKAKGKAGAIEGKVIFIGDRKPKNKRKLITKDTEVCGSGYKEDKVYVISGNGGVKNAVVFISGNLESGKEKHHKDKKIIQKNCEFRPRVISISKGAKLQIINEDEVKHEANGVQNFEPLFQLPQPKKGMVNEVKLDRPGIVEVTCNIHGWMKAWVVVVDNHFHSVTNEDGAFKITGVPPGKYKLKMWHEGFGEMEKEVEVKAGKTSKVIFKVGK